MYKLSIISITKDNHIELARTFTSISEIIKNNKNVEWVIVDGSVGSQCPFLNDFSQFCNIVYVSEKKSGISHAFNVGVSKASGEWLLFVNSGDTLVNDNILQYLTQLDPSIEIAYGISELYDPTLHQVVGHQGKKINSWPPMKMPFNHQSAFYKASSFKNSGMFKTTYRLGMDYEHLLRFKQSQLFFLNVLISRFYLGGASNNNVLEVYDEWCRGLIENGYFKIKAQVYKNVYKLRYLVKLFLYNKIKK